MFAGVMAAVPLAVFYVYAITYIPTVKLNALLTILLGAIIGYAVGWQAIRSEIRSRVFPAAIGLFCGLVAVYVAWGIDPIARFGEPQDGHLLSFFSPSFMWQYIQVFYANGFWAVGKGAPVNGIGLAVFWALEALCILGFAAWTPWNEFDHQVYCEKCGRWATSKKDALQVCVDSEDRLRTELENGDIALLCTSPRPNPGPGKFVKVGLDWCDECGETSCLDAWSVEVKLDKKGNATTTETQFIRKLLISREATIRLFELGES